MTGRACLIIGGPLHGQRRAIHGRYLSVPLVSGACFHHTQYSKDEIISRGIREFRYEVKKVPLAGCYVSLIVPELYSEAAISRALADYLEGVERNVGDY